MHSCQKRASQRGNVIEKQVGLESHSKSFFNVINQSNAGHHNELGEGKFHIFPCEHCNEAKRLAEETEAYCD
jgi:hypothetical protein